MYYDVYIDIVFLTNLLMDYVLLRIVGKLFLRKRNRGRILLAAAVGALFSCLILYVLPDMIFPAKVLLHGGCAWGMLVLGLDPVYSDNLWKPAIRKSSVHRRHRMEADDQTYRLYKA